MGIKKHKILCVITLTILCNVSAIAYSNISNRSTLQVLSVPSSNGYTFIIPCNKILFKNQNVGEIKLPDGKVIRYQYKHDSRWKNFHNKKKNLHFDGDLHYISFYARDYNVRLSSYRIKAKRDKNDDWESGIDVEGLGTRIDIVCEWFGISSENAQLIVTIEKKR